MQRARTSSEALDAQQSTHTLDLALLRRLANVGDAPKFVPREDLVRHAVRLLAVLYSKHHNAPLSRARPVIERLLPRLALRTTPPPGAAEVRELTDALLADLTD